MSIPIVQTAPFLMDCAWGGPRCSIPTVPGSPASRCGAAGMMSSPGLTDGAGGSPLPSVPRQNDAVWSEVKLNLNCNCEVEGGRTG